MKECPICRACWDDDVDCCPDDGRTLEASLEGSRLIDGKYLLERCLGDGAMGSVYRARHKDLQKIFALKLIRRHRLQSPDSLSRFRVEARALGKLQHPNIVQVTDYGVDPRSGGVPYLIMEHLEGMTLADRVSQKKSLPLDEALPIAEAIAAAVDYAHGCGILHRDLKLQNVFLSGGPEGAQVKILDFGLARIAGEPMLEEKHPIFSFPSLDGRKPGDEENGTRTFISEAREISGELATEARDRLTRAGTLMGTPGYIAPEIWKGTEATPASDIFSFGVLVFEMLVGQMPFQDPFHKPLLPSGVQKQVPREMDSALLASLELDPRARPAKAMDIVRRIKKAAADYRRRQWGAREIPRRIRIAGMMTLILVLGFIFLRNTPLAGNMENALADFHFRFVPVRAPDDRIVLVSIDEATLQADPTLLTDKAAEMGTLLQKVMDAGPLGLGIDFLLPERWNQSQVFTKFVLANQEKLILASYVSKDGVILGSELFKGLIMAALGSESRAERLLGFVNVEPDGDGRIRRASPGFPKTDGYWIMSMPARAFSLITKNEMPPDLLQKPIRLDYAIDSSKYRRVSWKDLPRIIDDQPDAFRGRFVLVGGEYEGSQDVHRVPRRAGLKAGEASGMVIQALTINTFLDNRRILEARPGPIALFLAAAGMLFFSAFLLRPKIFIVLMTEIAVLICYCLLAILLFRRNGLLLPAGLPIIVLTAGTAFAVFLRRALTFVAKEVEVT
jgi:serine/threonine protein kinase